MIGRRSFFGTLLAALAVPFVAKAAAPEYVPIDPVDPELYYSPQWGRLQFQRGLAVMTQTISEVSPHRCVLILNREPSSGVVVVRFENSVTLRFERPLEDRFSPLEVHWRINSTKGIEIEHGQRFDVDPTPFATFPADIEAFESIKTNGDELLLVVAGGLGYLVDEHGKVSPL